jgi:hypothetical protein
MATTTPSPTPAQSGKPISGRVHGGQQPVKSAHVYLYAAGFGGYETASTSQLTAGTKDASGNYYVVTGSNGLFTIPTGAYACAEGTPEYIYSIGGDSGFGPNSGLGLMAALGTCSGAPSAACPRPSR